MIFVDANVFMYAAGQPHPLKRAARDFFSEARRSNTILLTSAEVLQEMMHVYLSRRRLVALADAMALAEDTVSDVWSLEPEDVALARELYERHPNLSARDLCHLASCIRRGVSEIKTFDQAFQVAARREFEARKQR